MFCNMKLEVLNEEEVGKVKEWFEKKEFDKIHAIFIEREVYDRNMCKGCRNDNFIKEWVLYGIEVVWADKMEEDV